MVKLSPLTTYRASRRLTLEKFADMAGVNKSTVLRWEAGTTPIPLDRLEKLELITGIPREQLRPDVFERPSPDQPNEGRVA